MTTPTFDENGRYEAIVDGWTVSATRGIRRVGAYCAGRPPFSIYDDKFCPSLTSEVPLHILEAAIAAWRALFPAKEGA